MKIYKLMKDNEKLLSDAFTLCTSCKECAQMNGVEFV
jgi:hypothetical protein